MFLSGLRGYHEYWNPRLNEILAGCIGESMVGHLPKEISRVTRFVMLYDATVTVRSCILTTVDRRKFPSKTMVYNTDTISRYKTRVDNLQRVIPGVWHFECSQWE